MDDNNKDLRALALVVARVVNVGVLVFALVAQSLPLITAALVTAPAVVGAVEAPAGWQPSAYIACCLVAVVFALLVALVVARVGGFINHNIKNNNRYHAKYYQY